MYFTITVNSLWGCLHGGKVDHPIVFCILVYMQRVVLVPSAGIFLVLGSSYMRGRKILASCKLPLLGRSYTVHVVLGTNQTKVAWGHSLANHSNKG